SSDVEQSVVTGEASLPVPPAGVATTRSPVEPLPPPAGPTPSGPAHQAPLGTVCGARSGDKGGNANVGLWARSPDAYRWLVGFLTADRLRTLLPEARTLGIERHELPNLLALNFVVQGLLGDGVAASLRSHPQAQSLRDYVRAKVVPIPETLLARGPSSGVPQPGVRLQSEPIPGTIPIFNKEG